MFDETTRILFDGEEDEELEPTDFLAAMDFVAIVGPCTPAILTVVSEHVIATYKYGVLLRLISYGGSD